MGQNVVVLAHWHSRIRSGRGKNCGARTEGGTFLDFGQHSKGKKTCFGEPLVCNSG